MAERRKAIRRALKVVGFYTVAQILVILDGLRRETENARLSASVTQSIGPDGSNFASGELFELSSFTAEHR